MATEPLSLSGLLRPGLQPNVFPHFGLDSSFEDKFVLISEPLMIYVNSLLAELVQTGDEEALHESYLTKKAFALVDEHVRPTTTQEIACCAFLVGKLLQTVGTMIAGRVLQIRAMQDAWHGDARSNPTSFYGQSTATA